MIHVRSLFGMRGVFEHARDGILGLMLDLPKVFFAAETLGIDFVDILRTGRPRGKPTVLDNQFNSTERKAIRRNSRNLRAYELAGKFNHADLIA